MNKQVLQKIINSDSPYWEDLLLIAIASDKKAIPIILNMLHEERNHKNELITEMNALLSVADTIIEEPKLNRDNFIRKRIDDFYEKYKPDVAHCMNRPAKQLLSK